MGLERRVILPGVAILTLAALLAVPAGSTSRDDADRLAGPAPGVVQGRILTPEGEPVPGVRISLRRDDRTRETETDERGEYCLCRVAPGRDYLLTMQKEEFAGIVEKDFTVRRGKISILNVILRPARNFEVAPSGSERE